MTTTTCSDAPAALVVRTRDAKLLLWPAPMPLPRQAIVICAAPHTLVQRTWGDDDA